MIDASALLTDLQREVRALEDDLRLRTEELADLGAELRAEHTRAERSGRTARPYETWRDELVTQVAVSWVLASTFVRFCEDNRLVDTVLLAGPGERRRHADDAQVAYFHAHPTHSDREYLQHAFEGLAAHPAAAALFDARNPLHAISPSADAATRLLQFWRRVDPDTGALVHDFTDPSLDTRFLGDLYQDLSESARKTYALLQTPDFVEEFILDRTLEPALDELGLETVKVIDPACGSGHFLLGAFGRLVDRWQRAEPGTNPSELVQRAFRQVTGVDLNPFAVAIARFRLVIAGMRTCGISRLAAASGWELRLAAGDSLLFGNRPGEITRGGHAREDLHATPFEDVERLDELLLADQYHVVVGNPPYILASDPALNRAYRGRFPDVCSGKYQLVAPFVQRFFDLAVPGGYVGTIVSNAFMKREFGKKFVEGYLTAVDLTHILDTSGAYIPGHGTPTVILFGRDRAPVSSTIRTAMGVRGEPSTPADPAKGLVWTELVEHVDQPGFEGDYVSIADTPRDRFAKHPWSIGGGGAAELKEQLDRQRSRTLESCISSIGFLAITGEDELLANASAKVWVRRAVAPNGLRVFVEGEAVRDWDIAASTHSLFPYDAELRPLVDTMVDRILWSGRRLLETGLMFGNTRSDRGLRWTEYVNFSRERYRTPLSITFAELATQNNFVVDRGGKVFKQTAPVIKLREEASEGDHLAIVGALSSSLALFWMRQVFFPKPSNGVKRGLESEAWTARIQIDSTKLQQFPLPAVLPVERATRLDALAQERAALEPSAVCERQTPTRETLAEARARAEAIRAEQIALQEELDWEVYRLYGLLEEDLTAPPECVPPLRLGERAFEIALARKVASGEVETAWYTRHRSTPITELPAHWPEEYREVVERRLELIASNREIALIERPECKRRWAQDPWEVREQAALREWLLDRLESPAYWPEIELQSCARLADRAIHDPEFVQVAQLYVGSPEVDPLALVTELTAGDAVPFLAAYRYKDSGLRKRAQWERTWELQRKEDAIDARDDLTAEEKARRKQAEVGTIPVPPKYASADFQSTVYWRLRGKLDVPKERFIVYLGAEREADGSPVLGWAGWDHLERARALAAYAVEREQTEGWEADRLVPLLAGVWELVPWLKQWYDEPDPTVGQGLGTYFEGWVRSKAQELGTTADDLPTWRPPARATKRGRRR